MDFETQLSYLNLEVVFCLLCNLETILKPFETEFRFDFVPPKKRSDCSSIARDVISGHVGRT